MKSCSFRSLPACEVLHSAKEVLVATPWPLPLNSPPTLPAALPAASLPLSPSPSSLPPSPITAVAVC